MAENPGHKVPEPVRSPIELLQRYPFYTQLILLMGLVLLSMVPLNMIRGLVTEREARSQSAIDEVAASWSGKQRIVGPVLVVPYTKRIPNQEIDPQEIPSSEHETLERYLFLLPKELKIDGEMLPRSKYRGIYEILLYTAQTTFSGTFDPPDIAALGPADQIELNWREAKIIVCISDLGGSLNAVTLDWNGKMRTFEASGDPGRIVARLGLNGPPDAWPAPFSFQVDLNGSQSLGLLPIGKATEVTLRSSWPHPGFSGAFLPRNSEIDAEGFEARWQVSHLARGLPQQWDDRTERSSSYLVVTDSRGLTTSFVQPVDHYTKVERSVKYGILFIVLVCGALTVLEIVAGGRLHIVHYGMIAASLCLFYLLLLSLSEVTGFNAAYGFAAGASVPLIAFYTGSIMQSLKRGALVAGLLSTIYGYLYLTLRSEDFALLGGSLALFLALAATMFFTRRVDWHALGRPRATGEPTAQES